MEETVTEWVVEFMVAVEFVLWSVKAAKHEQREKMRTATPTSGNVRACAHARAHQHVGEQLVLVARGAVERECKDDGANGEDEAEDDVDFKRPRRLEQRRAQHEHAKEDAEHGVHLEDGPEEPHARVELHLDVIGACAAAERAAANELGTRSTRTCEGARKQPSRRAGKRAHREEQGLTSALRMLSWQRRLDRRPYTHS
eukprot:3541839-Pleurochrysis_carterae.AAC.2